MKNDTRIQNNINFIRVCRPETPIILTFTKNN